MSEIKQIFGITEKNPVNFSSPIRQSMEQFEDYAYKKVIYTKELYIGSSSIPAVSTGNGSPTSTPTQIGNFYIDTAALVLYIAMGTASSSDWKGVMTA